MGNEVAVIRDYDIRDKKLVDATAQSTIESTDAIEMKTTDGNQVFIDKASFIKAVGQAFTASDPKTFTKLLGMNGDGPMGIGASDLASVLGVDTIYEAVGIVDLGLPSGTLWADRNLGATSIYDAGYHFTWGNIKPYEDGEDYSSTPGGSLRGSFTQGDITYDAATNIQGKAWCVPTVDQTNELIRYTTSAYSNGVFTLTSTINGNKLYIPLNSPDDAYCVLWTCTYIGIDQGEKTSYTLAQSKDSGWRVGNNSNHNTDKMCIRGVICI